MPKHKIQLPASKSISNRLLVINALSGNKIEIDNLSTANDSVILNGILSSYIPHANPTIKEINCEDAGTVMRFLTAFFATQKGQWLLRGTDRMHQRPIKILVDRLRELDADIKYLGKEGYPPLLITGKSLKGKKISVNASISSQYISALLMIAPYLKNELQIELLGTVASKPYIDMTLRLMQQCGVESSFEDNLITVEKGSYASLEVNVESDWSSASYWYAFTALSNDLDIELEGLLQNSLQGDSIVADWMKELGVETTYTENGIFIKSSETVVQIFENDFSNCPDLAPTFICLCAAKGITGKFNGLESLAIKESDRTNALANELEKVGVRFSQKNNHWELEPNPALKNIDIPIEFGAYGDHRLAMALVMFEMVLPQVVIKNKEVVKKSYPNFWADFDTHFNTLYGVKQ